MSELLRFFKDMRDNGYGLAEIAAQLGTSAIAEPVAGFAAMYDPVHGADAIREGMTYQPRSDAAKMYQQGAANAIGQAVKPVMPIIDTWKKGVDIAGQYSPVVGAGLRTVPTAIGIAMGAKPALQAGRQASEGLGAMQGRMIANASAPRTLNTGYMGQRGAINPSDFNLVTNPDGTVTMYHGTTKDAAKKIIQERKLLSAGEPDVYMTTDPMAGYGDGTTVKFNIDPKHINLDDEFPSGRVDFRMPAAKGWRIQNPEINTPKRPLTEFEQAHLLAQQRAALPVNQRGLDLPADNTAMDRARAMGFDYARRSQSSKTPFNDVDYGMFVKHGGDIESSLDDISHYGKGQWLGRADVNVEDVKKEILKAIRKSGVNNDYGTTAAKLTRESIPDDIVNSAGSWDAPDIAEKIINDLYDKGIKAVKTPDGAIIWDKSNIRSIDAAFDPFNRDSSNLLAQSAKLAPTTALGAYMYNEKRKKSQQGKQ
jgi:hypothetical protein